MKATETVEKMINDTNDLTESSQQRDVNESDPNEMKREMTMKGASHGR